MKKILLLGGSAQQVIAIKTAKELGYETILCDYLSNNPGQYEADKFYLESTTDKKAILEIARKEEISGIVAYASDPAAPTAAYVAEKLCLPSNPYESVEILCNKDKFRKFLNENGFNTPKAGGYSCVEEAMKEIDQYCLPIIIKPVDSSGSKGVTVLHELAEIEKAIAFALSFSRSKRFIVEEFIEKKHSYLIGGDIFVDNGKVVLWGLLNCHRDSKVNILVPVGKSYPLALEESDIQNVKRTLQEIVDKLQIRSGAMNVELLVDKSNRVWPIDVGPRNGGNMIPDLLGMIFNINIVEMSIEAAMGLENHMQFGTGEGCYATHNLHSNTNGMFKNIEFSEDIRKNVIRTNVYVKSGDKVEYFDNAAKALGIVFLKFDNKKEMLDKLEKIDQHIKIILEK